jgi:hypothetical protein
MCEIVLHGIRQEICYRPNPCSTSFIFIIRLSIFVSENIYIYIFKYTYSNLNLNKTTKTNMVSRYLFVSDSIMYVRAKR